MQVSNAARSVSPGAGDLVGRYSYPGLPKRRAMSSRRCTARSIMLFGSIGFLQSEEWCRPDIGTRDWVGSGDAHPFSSTRTRNRGLGHRRVATRPAGGCACALGRFEHERRVAGKRMCFTPHPPLRGTFSRKGRRKWTRYPAEAGTRTPYQPVVEQPRNRPGVTTPASAFDFPGPVIPGMVVETGSVSPPADGPPLRTGTAVSRIGPGWMSSSSRSWRRWLPP